MIEIKNLTKEYSIKQKGKNKEVLKVLDNLNLEIKDNSIFGIIGLSGAGKTTLFRILSALEKPTHGHIYVNDECVDALNGGTLRKFRKKLGVAFQGYHLLMQQNIFQNIAFPLKMNGYPKDKIKDRVQELLRVVGLEEKTLEYPSRLSGGQCQRVAIARALATRPEILLLDEPTSALDPFTTKQILALLKEIQITYQITIIIITHEMKVVQNICDEVAVLDQGKIVEFGEVTNVLQNPQHTMTKLLLDKEI